jgi:hypothetical protein
VARSVCSVVPCGAVNVLWQRQSQCGDINGLLSMTATTLCNTGTHVAACRGQKGGGETPLLFQQTPTGVQTRQKGVHVGDAKSQKARSRDKLSLRCFSSESDKQGDEEKGKRSAYTSLSATT